MCPDISPIMDSTREGRYATTLFSRQVRQPAAAQISSLRDHRICRCQ